MRKYKKISRKECFALLKKYFVPENVIKHVKRVEGVSVFLAKKMIANGESIDLEAVRAGALLHDIGKIISIKQGEKENVVSKKILGKEKLPKIAGIAEKHMLSRILDGDIFQWSLEEKIVYYADKRVKHDRLVSVKERIEDLIERYAEGKETIKKCFQPIKKLEKELFKKARIKGLSGFE